MRRRAQAGRAGGFTLVEIMVAMVVYSTLFAALAAGVVALQRSFSATEKYSRSVSEQLRILDYVARDVRRASAVTITQYSKKLDLTVPDQYANAGTSRTFRTPSVSMAAVTYGTTPGTVSYYTSGQIASARRAAWRK
jgi:prepilin-type N-terminal cleavage/methylation domain-containing protein